MTFHLNFNKHEYCGYRISSLHINIAEVTSRRKANLGRWDYQMLFEHLNFKIIKFLCFMLPVWLYVAG